LLDQEDKMLRYHDEIHWDYSNKVMIVAVVELVMLLFDYVIFLVFRTTNSYYAHTYTLLLEEPVGG
jgi:hypothetical protein